MSLAEQEAVDIFNELQLATDGSSKVALLKSLSEAVIQREPALIDTFLPKVIELQAEHNVVVRRGILDFYDACLLVNQRGTTLLAGITCISYLLQDSAGGTAKRAIASIFNVLRYTLAYITQQPENISEEVSRSWDLVMHCLERVKDILKDDTANTGARLSASKLLEQTIILFTGDQMPKTPPIISSVVAFPIVSKASKKVLVESAQNALQCMTETLKRLGCERNHGTLCLTIIRSLSVVLLGRSQFAGKIVPSLLSMAKQEDIKLHSDTKKPDQKVAAAIEGAIRGFASSGSTFANPWKKKISVALEDMGATPMEKDVKKDNKRQREEELSKRSRFRSEIPDAIPVMRHAEENIQADIARCLQTRNILELEQLVDKADLNLLVSLLCGSLSSIAVVEVAQWQRLDNTFVDAILDIGLHFAKIRASNSDLKKNGAPMRSFEDPLKPSVLSEQDASSGRIAALKRILATHKVPSSSARLKWYLISRLATIYPDSDDTEEVLVSHIMEDYNGRQGHQIFSNWLHMLFFEAFAENVDTSLKDLANSRYEKAFETILLAMSTELSGKDRALIKLMEEVPMIPPRVTVPILESMLREPNGQDTVALIVARDAILNRPPSRSALLDLVLDAAVSETDALRNKAIKMCANQLFLHEKLEAKIEQFAREQIANATEENASTEDQAFSKASLFCALCTKKFSLLKDLFYIYGNSVSAIKMAVKSSISSIVATMDPIDKELLTVIEAPPSGSLDLVIEVIEHFSSQRLPKKFVTCVKELFDKQKDLRIIIPVVPHLVQGEAIALLPEIIQMESEKLKTTIPCLCSKVYEGQNAPVLSPSELLTQLHTIDYKKSAGLLKSAMASINVCLSLPEHFTAEVIAASLSQLITRVPLPQLFMRTVLQSLTSSPQLREFIVGMLGQLAAKQIWTNATQWKGWMMAVQQIGADSYPILLRLPANILAQAVESFHEDMRMNLADYAMENAAGDLPAASIKVLSKYKKK